MEVNSAQDKSILLISFVNQSVALICSLNVRSEHSPMTACTVIQGKLMQSWHWHWITFFLSCRSHNDDISPRMNPWNLSTADQMTQNERHCEPYNNDSCESLMLNDFAPLSSLTVKPNLCNVLFRSTPSLALVGYVICWFWHETSQLL